MTELRVWRAILINIAITLLSKMRLDWGKKDSSL